MTREEIMHLEERLRQAELGPDPPSSRSIWRTMSSWMGCSSRRESSKRTARLRQGAEGLRRSTWKYGTFVEHGPAVVLTCEGHYEGPQFTGTIKFMRVWLKRDGRWQIIAGSTLK
jgi:hypothetical protein